MYLKENVVEKLHVKWKGYDNRDNVLNETF